MLSQMDPPSKAVSGAAQGPSIYGPSDGFEVTGRLMMSVLLVLFMLLLLFLFFHALSRWFSHLHHRRRSRPLRRRQPNFIFTFPPRAELNSAGRPAGLDPMLLGSLPCFVYSPPHGDDDGLECSICLCGFEEGEKGRTLSGCGHCFHIDCIDLWFHSHISCPICRAEVKSDPSIYNPVPIGTTLTPNSNETSLRSGEGSETVMLESGKPPPLDSPSFAGIKRVLMGEGRIGCSSNVGSDLETGEQQSHRYDGEGEARCTPGIELKTFNF